MFCVVSEICNGVSDCWLSDVVITSDPRSDFLSFLPFTLSFFLRSLGALRLSNVASLLAPFDVASSFLGLACF